MDYRKNVCWQLIEADKKHELNQTKVWLKMLQTSSNDLYLDGIKHLLHKEEPLFVIRILYDLMETEDNIELCTVLIKFLSKEQRELGFHEILQDFERTVLFKRVRRSPMKNELRTFFGLLYFLEEKRYLFPMIKTYFTTHERPIDVISRKISEVMWHCENKNPTEDEARISEDYFKVLLTNTNFEMARHSGNESLFALLEASKTFLIKSEIFKVLFKDQTTSEKLPRNIWY